MSRNLRKAHHRKMRSIIKTKVFPLLFPNLPRPNFAGRKGAEVPATVLCFILTAELPGLDYSCNCNDHRFERSWKTRYNAKENVNQPSREFSVFELPENWKYEAARFVTPKPIRTTSCHEIRINAVLTTRSCDQWAKHGLVRRHCKPPSIWESLFRSFPQRLARTIG